MKSLIRAAVFVTWAVGLHLTVANASVIYTMAENSVLLGGIADVAAVNQIAQTFTALKDGELAAISVFLSRNGPQLPAEVLVDIRLTSGGLPGPILATASMPTNSIGAAYGVSYIQTADFSHDHISLMAGSLYAFSLRAPDGDPGHAYASGSGNAYSGGGSYYTLDSGNSWTQQTGYDLTFMVTALQNSDGDGVPDDIDQCPDTPAGAIVDTHGCSIDQLVPCGGPRSGGTWKNHGQYVSGIAETAHAFVVAGLINEGQAAAVVKAAAQSSCGEN
jgi:hypothetical protein